MDKMTPGQLGVIALITVCVVISKWLIDVRHAWVPQVTHGLRMASLYLRALVHRYFTIRIPTPDELADYVENNEAKTRGADTEYLVPPDTDAEYTTSTEPVSTSITVTDTTALVRHLAIIRKPNGDYAMSGNRIVAAVEMGRNEVLDLVRAARGTEPAPQEPYDPRKHIMVNGKEWIAR